MDAVSRKLWQHFSLWKAGLFGTLWERVSRDCHPRVRKLGEPFKLNYKKVTRLVDDSQLSRAAARLTSDGLVEPTPDLFQRVKMLFPQKDLTGLINPPVNPPVRSTIEYLQKLMFKLLRWTAPGPSGLRTEHERGFQSRRPTLDADVLSALTIFVNASLAGDLPKKCLPFLCGGKVVPLAKKRRAEFAL